MKTQLDLALEIVGRLKLEEQNPIKMDDLIRLESYIEEAKNIYEEADDDKPG